MYAQNMIKTLFTIYRFLERLANSIDRIVEVRAINACHVYLENTAYNNIEKVAKDIMELTERKVTLINLKIIVDKILENIGKNHSRYIIMKYIEDRSIFEIADIFQVSVRTLSRWNNHSILMGATYLQNRGLDFNALSDLIKNEKWILKVFNNFNKKSQENRRVEKETKIMQRACKEYNKFLC